MTRARTIRTLAAIGATTVLLATACGGDDAGSRPRTAASTVDSAEVASTTSAPPDPVEMAAFQRDVAEQCGAATNTLAAIPPEEGTASRRRRAARDPDRAGTVLGVRRAHRPG